MPQPKDKDCLNGHNGSNGSKTMDTKTRPLYMFHRRDHLKTGDTYRLKVKGWEKTFHANRDQKKAGVAILTSDKIDFEIKA